MDLETFNDFCRNLPGAEHVVQWGGADVWKIGGKVIALAREEDGMAQVTFKASDMAFEILCDSPGIRPAPYLASRGLKWLQHYATPGLSDDSLRAHIRASYDMALARLSKRKRAELGL
ncbi:MmcQ/YjbR family DNA-binding protein [Sulfitobacter aestuarii]|uniref:MmcQ/YjbR family DNA-binding protein n=1 Tax=Sulfitobacter aestuarii TaxID=2161676 RepID=A0ABW5U2X0_9RHOB